MNIKLGFVCAAVLSLSAIAAQPPPAAQNQPGLLNFSNGWHLPGWQFSVTEGWQSQYIFRGQDLTPGADGLFTSDLQATVPGFAKGQTLTLGAWAGLQVGAANYAGNPWELNGTQAKGPTFSRIVGTRTYYKEQVWTKQNSFRELDLTANYKMELGPVLLAEFGDIKYFSNYDAKTTVHLHSAPAGYLYIATHTRYETDGYSSGVESENRNEVYLNLGTNPKWCDWAVPSLTYYETFRQRATYGQFDQFTAYPTHFRGKFQSVHPARYGGYLEGRVDGHVPWIRKDGRDIFGLRPYALLSISFDDEAEGTPNYGRRYFSGWNNFEIGTDAPWQVNRYLTLAASVAWSHELIVPVASTSRNEVWSGLRATVTF